MGNHHNPWEDCKPWWERMQDEQKPDVVFIVNGGTGGCSLCASAGKIHGETCPQCAGKGYLGPDPRVVVDAARQTMDRTKCTLLSTQDVRDYILTFYANTTTIHRLAKDVETLLVQNEVFWLLCRSYEKEDDASPHVPAQDDESGNPVEAEGPRYTAARIAMIDKERARAEAAEARCRQLEAQVAASSAEVEWNELHPATSDLVESFALALKEKLLKAQRKYGHSDGWVEPGWRDICVAQLVQHIHKGDPLDVAAYAAFCWHHGWSTAPDEKESS